MKNFVFLILLILTGSAYGQQTIQSYNQIEAKDSFTLRGKTISEISTDTLLGNSDKKVSTQKAVKINLDKKYESLSKVGPNLIVFKTANRTDTLEFVGGVGSVGTVNSVNGIYPINGNVTIPLDGGGTGGTSLNGTGFVKANGTTISYDNTNYISDTSALHQQLVNQLAAIQANASSITLKQDKLNGTGFVKANGTAISYDNTAYVSDTSLLHQQLVNQLAAIQANASAITLKQNQLNGSGFVKMSGTTASYDNSTYITSESDPKRLSSIAVTGTTTKTVTATLADASTVSTTFTDATGGSTVDTVNYIATKTDLKGQVLGTLYNKNSWTSASDFTQVGTNTLSFTGNKINVSGASKAISATLNTSNTTLPTVLRITSYGGTMLEKYRFVAKIKVNQAPSATSYGFSVGTYSISSGGISNAMGYFNMSTATGTGTVSILAGSTNATAAISSNALTFSQNDYILLTTERTPDKLTVTAQNLTAGGEVTASYAWDATSISSFLLPNTSNFAIGNMGGSYIVDSIGISSNETKGANLLLVGDSKFAGYATPFEGRIGTILDKTYIAGTIVSSGQGDKTADVLLHLPEIISLAPKQVLLCIGRNDVVSGVASGTWQGNLSSIVSQLQTAGISVVLLDAIYETGGLANQPALVTYIQTTFPNNYIPAYSATTGIAPASDGIHPTFTTTKVVADVIYNSPLILDYGKYPNGKMQNTAFNYVSNNHFYNGNIYDMGRTLTPDVVSAGDIVLRSSGAITAASSIASQKTRLEFGRDIVFRSYTGSAALAALSAFTFYTGRTTTGTQTQAASITNGGLLLMGTAQAGPNATNSDIILPTGSGLGGAISPVVGAETRIIPQTTGGDMEFRNFQQRGKFITYASGGIAGGQSEAMRINPSSNVGVNETSDIGTVSLAVGGISRGFMSPRMTTAQRDAIVGISSITIASAGSGYTNTASSPLVFSGGAGTNAVAYATITGGAVTGVTLVSSGYGYTSAPTATVTSGAGTGATFTVNLMTSPVEGTEIYNLTLHQKQYYNGTTWVSY